jgi:hypothetical protein
MLSMWNQFDKFNIVMKGKEKMGYFLICHLGKVDIHFCHHPPHDQWMSLFFCDSWHANAYWKEIL